jgi:RNA polymerase sigma-70 factor (ECF subfamily)
LAPTLGGDAGLILAVAVDGRTQQEAGERLGLGREAARKRYQRGLGRLRDVLA